MQIKPKKRLGQNFLTDKNIRKKIIHACDIKPSDIILEIGPGKGELTQSICDAAAKVYAVEIDRQLYEILKAGFNDTDKITLINRSILDTDLNLILKNHPGKKIKVIGNIPYYISTAIIEHLLKYKEGISHIFITVQKEFARRVVSTPGSKEYGSLSCFLQYYTRPRILFNITKHCFKPAPKVDSCLLSIEIRKKPAVKVDNEALFFKIIRGAFSQRRKTLKNCLKNIISIEDIDKFLKQNSMDTNIRAEKLSLDEFAKLTDIAVKKKHD